jgi:hypothetical protein
MQCNKTGRAKKKYQKNDNVFGKYDYKRYLLGGIIGFEPAFTVFGRFTFGSKFGLDCNYQRTKTNILRIYSNSQTSGNTIRMSKIIISKYSVQIFQLIYICLVS